MTSEVDETRIDRKRNDRNLYTANLVVKNLMCAKLFTKHWKNLPIASNKKLKVIYNESYCRDLVENLLT